MTSSATFIQWCESQVNTTEDPPGSNKTPYAALAHLPDGQFWCHTFLVAGAMVTGLPLPSGVAVAGTKFAFDHWTQAGKAGTEPRIGAWGYIHFPECDDPGICHVEVLVASNPDGSWKTIGGNTSFDGIPASQDHGGAVAAKTRASHLFVGFGYPDYEVVSTSTANPEDEPMQFVAPCLWMPANANGTEPYFVINRGDTDHDFLVASVDGAPFTPPWVNGFKAPASALFQYEDLVVLGAFSRRVRATSGPVQGPLVYPDHVAVACEGGGVYRIAQRAP
jgi:hypothetical protein